MIKATIILGQDAVMRYRETGKLPSEQWLMDNGGVVDEKNFTPRLNITLILKPYPIPMDGLIMKSSGKAKHPV